jgi:hypothetical protein
VIAFEKTLLPQFVAGGFAVEFLPLFVGFIERVVTVGVVFGASGRFDQCVSQATKKVVHRLPLARILP